MLTIDVILVALECVHFFHIANVVDLDEIIASSREQPVAVHVPLDTHHCCLVGVANREGRKYRKKIEYFNRGKDEQLTMAHKQIKAKKVTQKEEKH